MSRLLVQHLPNGALSNIKEASQDRRYERIEIFRGVLREWLRYENSGIIDQHINAAESFIAVSGLFAPWGHHRYLRLLMQAGISS